MKKMLAAAALCLAPVAANAATLTYNGAGFSLPDLANRSSTITVTDNVIVTGISLTLNGYTHSYLRDLDSYLTHNATSAQFMSNDLASGQDVSGDITFLDGASSYYGVSGNVVGTGTYSGRQENGAAQNFGAFLGQSSLGDWTLNMIDRQGVDGGNLGSWTLTIQYDAVDGAVPEPATWAMMIMGFGLIGAAVRRQPKVKVAFAA